MEQPGNSGVSEENLDEALEESFPASDPLSFWSGPDRSTASPARGARPGEPSRGADPVPRG